MQLWETSNLTGWVAAVLERCGLSDADAKEAARIIVRTDMRGIRSHGMARLSAYASNLKKGLSKPKPDFRVEKRSGAIFFDADRALGQIAGTRAVELAVDLARSQSTAAVVIRNTGHLGALGVLIAAAAEAGMVGILMQNAPPMMALPGARARAIGNNPLAFAAPVTDRAPLVFDMATSEVAFGRILEAARSGVPIPPNWALDAGGRETRSASDAISGILLPSAAHKGIGLAMLVECLAGALSGTDPSKYDRSQKLPDAFGGFALVINPALYVGAEAFRENMTSWLTRYQAAGEDMRYPGEGAARLEAQAEREGLDMPPALVKNMQRLGAEYGLPFPDPKAD